MTNPEKQTCNLLNFFSLAAFLGQSFNKNNILTSRPTQPPRRVPNINTGLRKDCPTGLHGFPKQVPNGYFEKFILFNQYLGVVGPTPSLRHDFMADINGGGDPIDPKSGWSST